MDPALISNETKIIKSMFAFGTDIHFVFYQPNFETAFDRAHSLILDMENKLSVFKPKSSVAKLNRYGNYIPIKVFPEVYELIKKSIEYNLFSEGYFDITVKRLIDVWQEAKQKNQMPEGEKVELALMYTGSENIQLLSNCRVKLKNKVKVDFGAIAKGFLADKIREIFEQEGINSAIVDLGGHILTVGKKT
ncbi:FAD:protein FMN transferase [Caldicellulosiruptor acetigenus]|uniref:FAD:protein FMN transferase n=1 Tax=Caldicellulosiruptor acetigenus TaxID=301953 RepID=UPI0002DB1EBB|nr:FAD:protein FMN transferase [Caldicellulosiruptor acetigenus]